MNRLTTDKELIDLYLAGNEIGFELLMEKYRNYIFQFINSKIKDTDISNDIFQETFIKVILSLKKGNYNESGKFLSWTLRIANNMVMDHFRKIDRKQLFDQSKDYSLLYNLPEIPNDLENIEKNEYNFSKIKCLIDNLVPEQKEVLHLRFNEEKTFKEIAESSKISINTALGRFSYAIKNLRKEIIKQNIILQ